MEVGVECFLTRYLVCIMIKKTKGSEKMDEKTIIVGGKKGKISFHIFENCKEVDVVVVDHKQALTIARDIISILSYDAKFEDGE